MKTQIWGSYFQRVHSLIHSFTKTCATSCTGARSKEIKVEKIGYRVLQLVV